MPAIDDPQVLASLIQAVGTILGALIVGVAGGIITTRYNKARDRQDKESQWRQHAIELTKLDVERKLKWQDQAIELIKLQADAKVKFDRSEFDRPRAPVLDFLANYRELVELRDNEPPGWRTPAELYDTILKQRTHQGRKPIGPGTGDEQASGQA